MTDGKTGSDEASVEITIETNRPPVANPDEVHAHGRVMATVDPIANDDDPDRDPLTLVSVSSDRLGCSLSGCVYTPPAAPGGVYPFTDDIDYVISDGHGHTAVGTVHVQVVANSDPTASDDTVTTRTGKLVLFDVLGNDTDDDHDPLTIVASTAAQHGTVACPSSDFRQAPSCTYVSQAGYLGDDTFTYTISDGLGGETSTATVTITVVPLNTPVDAKDDAVTIYRAVSTDINVIANDEDTEHDPLRIVSWTPAPQEQTGKHGYVSCSSQPGSGVCRYTPPPGNTTFPLVDTFTYRVTDGFGASDEATVTVTLDNRPPNATPDHAVAHGAVPHPIDVLGNDSDPDGDPIVALVADLSGTTGAVDCNVLTGICQYTPRTASSGQDVFHYTITDSRGASATTTVTVDVVANRDPDALDDFYNVGGSLAPSFINVRSNDTDPESDPISVVVHGPVATAHGTVECDAQGCIYTRSPGPAANDSFDYKIVDGHGGDDTATVHIGLDEVLLVVGLRSTPNPSSHGQPVTFTATVSAPGLGLPTGQVTFLDDGTSIGTVPLTFGTARLTTDALAAGSHPMVASFVGSDGLAGSTGTSPMLTQVVTSAATTTAVTSDVDSVGCRCGGDVHSHGRTRRILGWHSGRHRDVPRRDDRARQRDAQWRKRDPCDLDIDGRRPRHHGPLQRGRIVHGLDLERAPAACRHAHGDRRPGDPRGGRGSDPDRRPRQRHAIPMASQRCPSSGCPIPTTARHRSMTPGRPATPPTTRSSISLTTISTGPTASRTRSATGRRRLRPTSRSWSRRSTIRRSRSHRSWRRRSLPGRRGPSR